MKSTDKTPTTRRVGKTYICDYLELQSFLHSSSFHITEEDYYVINNETKGGYFHEQHRYE